MWKAVYPGKLERVRRVNNGSVCTPNPEPMKNFTCRCGVDEVLLPEGVHLTVVVSSVQYHSGIIMSWCSRHGWLRAAWVYVITDSRCRDIRVLQYNFIISITMQCY